MSMFAQALLARVAVAQKRLHALESRDASGKLSAAEGVRAALREMSELLEMLRSATEQLQAASDDLATARREAAAQTERYHELHECLPVASILTDDAGTVEQVNTLAATLLNVARTRLAGKPLLLFVPDREQYFRLLDRVRGAGAASDTLLVRPRDKKPRTVDVRVCVMPLQARWCWVFDAQRADAE
ncbi:MAG TPA: PAS domain-containing protein [Vicinamibacterales bacterium]|nr:PAS domain-containing protein [Vicinamibacterales bacterium]